MTKVNDIDKPKELLIKELQHLRARLAHESPPHHSPQTADHYRLLMEQSPDWITTTDNHGKFLDVNDAGCQLTGYSRQELLNLSLADLIPEQDLQKEPFRFDKLRTGHTVEIQRRIRRKDGSLFLAEVHARMLPDGTMQGIARDISEQKLIQNALKQSEQQYRTTIDAMDDMVHVIDADFHILLANHALVNWCTQNGCDPHWQEKTPFDLFKFLDDKIRREYRQVFKQGNVLTTEECYEINGRHHTTECRKIPVIESGRVVRVVTVIRDITQRKQNEDELDQYRSHLEHLVGQRTADLAAANQRLQHEITQHRQTHQTLQAERQLLQTIVDNLPYSVYLKDTQGRFLFANAFCTKVLNVDSEEKLIGKTDADFGVFTPEQLQAFRQEEKRVTTTGKPLLNNLQSASDDPNDHRWASVSKMPWYGPDGNIVGIIGLNRDITKLKLAADALHKRSDLLKLLANISTRFVGLEPDQLEPAVKNALKEVAHFVGAHAAVVVQFAPQGLPARCTHLWGHPDACQQTPPHTWQALHGNWTINRLQNRQIINIARLNDWPDQAHHDRQRCQKADIQAAALIPLLHADTTTGYLGFYVHHNEHAWPRDTITSLRMIADTFANALAHQQVQLALRQSEEQYRTLVENAHAAIFTIDRQGIYHFVNGLGAQQLGSTPQAVIGRTIWDIFPRPQADQHMQAIRHVIDSSRGVERETVTVVQGKKRHYRMSIQPLHDSKPIQRALGIALDITETKLAEENAREKELHYRTLIDTMSEGFAIHNADNILTYVNQRLCDITGRAPNELLGNPASLLVSPDSLAAYQHQQVRRRKGKPVRYEMKIQKKDGSQVPTLVSARGFFDNQHNYTGCFIVLTDISEQKEAQEQLDVFREKMAQAERLTQLGVVGATMAHRLSQPLTVVRLLLQESLTQITETDACPTAATYIDDSLAELANAIKVIDQFRSVARRPASACRTPISLAALAQQAIYALEDSAQRAKLHLLTYNLEQLPPVLADPHQIEQVLFILIQNAVQAAPQNRWTTLRITGQPDNTHVHLSLDDDCGGIDPLHMPRLFEPFFTTKPPSQGTGLGLPIVQHIVEGHGGKVIVDNRPGKGVTFRLTLPLAPHTRRQPPNPLGM